MGLRSRGARVKGYIMNNETGESKAFLLNPSSITESQTASYTRSNAVGGNYPRHEYNGGDVQTVPVELYLKGAPWEVKGWIKWLKKFLPKMTAKINFAPPPTMTFSLGFYTRKCVMTSFRVSYTELNENLQPTEATVSITLEVVIE